MFSLGKSKKKETIYLDHASTTPVLPEVVTEMNRYHTENFYNPSSLYRKGVLVKKDIDNYRKKINELLHTQATDVIFTASGTEANNLTLLGFRSNDGRFDGKHFVTSNIEHTSVLDVFSEIEKLGGSVTYIEVDEQGLINPKDILPAIKENTVLISFIFAHNEIGVIQDIKTISKMVRKAEKNLGVKVPIHIDASQAPNYVEINMLKIGVDMMTLDAQKIYGPKGIGVLIKKRSLDLRPVIFGGKQEDGLRAGTEPASLIAGFTKALEIAVKDQKKETKRLAELRDWMIERILKKFPDSSLNGSPSQRLANNINICFPGLDAEYAVIQLDYAGVLCSYASSCSSLGDSLASYAVDALKKGNCGSSSLRFTLGRSTTKKDLELVIEKLSEIIDKQK